MPDEQDEPQSIRPFWSGTITFGLVSIPVDVYPANRSGGVPLHMIGPNGVRLRRRYYSPATGRDLDPDEIVRGYEFKRDKYIVVTDDELERLAPAMSRDINLRRFVEYTAIPEFYFERGYFLAPAGGSAKAYRLLAETMQRSGRAGIATFVMRGKEYLVAIIAEDGLLRAETMRFVDEVRSADDVGLPKKKRAPAQTVRAFEQIIAKRSVDKLPRQEMEDRQSERLLKLVERKQKTGREVVGTTRGKADKEQVVDLLDVLKRALAAGGAARSGKRTHAKRTRAGAA